MCYQLFYLFDILSFVFGDLRNKAAVHIRNIIYIKQLLLLAFRYKGINIFKKLLY